MNPDWTTLAESLRAELAEYGGLLHLFEEQQSRLFARDPDGVLRISTDIEAQVRLLHECRGRREALVAAFAAAHGAPPTATLRSLLPHVAADARPLVAALIGEVNRLIHRVRRLARHNHALLVRAVESHQDTLRALRPDAFMQTYTAAGRKAVAATVRPPAALEAAG
ncbi:MAG TPA: flagellar protein FlgN [Opitutaceae bacterium]|nr:flagellar protein FlgN [Opitutaceae bacterium]